MQAAEARLESVGFPTFEIPEFENKNAPRFFVQMVDDIMSTDCPGIPHQTLARGVITPVLSTRQVLPFVEIRESDLIPTSERRDESGRVYAAQVWRPAKYEADRLNKLEGETEYKTGLVEIEALRDAPQVYQQNANKIIYSGLENGQLPETNAELREYLVERLAEIRRDAPALADPDDFETLLKVGAELIAALDY